MTWEKNKLMHYITGAVIVIAIIVNIMGRYFHLFNHSHGGGSIVTSSEIESLFGTTLNVLLVLPIIFFVISMILYKRDKKYSYIPYLLTLALTFGSIAIISGGSGRVEFHFSIFMVVAALGYYQEVRLLLMMTATFAVQHILGLLYFPELVFGVQHYMFSMFLLHGIFLVLTSSAVSWQVYNGKKIETSYQEKQATQREKIIDEIVGRLSSTSGQILQVSDTLSVYTKQSFDASTQSAASMDNVANGTEHQLSIIQDNRNVISHINNDIQTINQTAQIVSERSNTSAEKARNGSDITKSLLEQITEINKDVDQSFSTIEELNRRSQAIEGIIEVISGIADQTNLLALNAAIEAARAGEYGKGFSVVANEVKKLAEESLAASNNISEIVKLMLSESDQSVESMKHVKQSAVKGLGIAQHSNEVFHQISEASNEVAIQIREISSLTEGLTLSSNKVNKAMEDVLHSVQETVSGTKEGILSTNQQYELTESTVLVSKELNNLTEELDGVIRALKN